LPPIAGDIDSSEELEKFQEKIGQSMWEADHVDEEANIPGHLDSVCTLFGTHLEMHLSE
jgi:hypothetical protein